MSFALTQLSGFGGRGGASFTFTVGGAATSTTDGASYTLSGIDIGAAATGRIVVVAFGIQDNGNNPTVTSATIGGNSATIYQNTNASTVNAGFLVAQVDTGATADVVVNGGANAFQSIQIQAFALYGLASATPHDTAGTTGTTATNPSGSLDCPAWGIIIGVVEWRDTVATTTTWTNLTNEISDSFIDGTSSVAFSYEQFSSVQTGLTITATGSQAPLQHALSLISFG